MNRFFAALIGALLQLAVIAVGMVLALCLLGVVLVLLAAWFLRMGWARVTGRPVARWAMPFNPTGRFRQAYGAAGQWPRRGAAPAADRVDQDVTDAEVVREIRRDERDAR